MTNHATGEERVIDRRMVDLTPLEIAAVRGQVDVIVEEIPKRASWVERARVIREQFPSVTAGADGWKRIFDQDESIMTTLYNVVLVHDQALGKRGVKKELDRATAQPRLMQLLGRDYSLERFADAVKTLKELRRVSTRQIERRTGFSTGHLYRLFHGSEPTTYDIEQMAAMFDKHPSYFLEWRNAYVTVVLCDRLTEVPEASVDMYRKMAFG